MNDFKAVISQLQAERDKLDRAISVLRSLDSGSVSRGVEARVVPTRTKISAKGLAAIRRAQKARWAKVRASKK